MSKIDPAVLNSNFLSKIAAGETKGAADAGTEFTRLTLREEGLLRKILPPKTITPADLDKQLDTDKPVKILDKEVSQPLSVSVPFGSLPVNQYVRGARYRVDFARLVTPNYTKDVIELGQYDYDIREIFKDNAIKDHMTAEDVPWFALINAIVSNDPDNATQVGNQPSAMTGKVQYYDFTDATKNPYGLTGFSRDSIVSFFTIATRGYGDGTVSTPIRLHTDLAVMNVNTGMEFVKFLPTEIGRPLSERMASEGLVEDNFFGKRFIFTIKDDIVKDGEIYGFPKPQFLGVFLELEQPTMFIENRAFLLEFFIYSCIGASVANSFGVSKAKFFNLS